MDNTFLKDFLMISSFNTLKWLVVLILLFLFMVFLKKKHINFSNRMLIGTGIGILLGFAIQFVAKFPENPTEITWINESTKWFSLFGNGFIDLIRMIIIPLIVISIIHIIINMKQDTKIKQLTIYTLVILFSTVAVATLIGIVVAFLFKLGLNSNIIGGTSQIKEIKSLVDVLRNLIPKNPVEAMSSSNVIAVVIFSIFVGTAAKKMSKPFGKTIEHFSKIIEALHKIIISITMTIINLMPYAVIPLLANTIAQRGIKSILDVILFILALYFATFIMFLVHLGLLSVFGFNPITYLKKAFPVLILAFTSRSSLGCIPVTLETLDSLGANSSTSTFVASFGATTGMNGCAGIFPGMLIIMVANITGNPINLSFLVMSLLVITISSVGIAGVPGTATTSASINLSAVGFGQYFDLTSPILAIDPILDMARTMINVNGVLTTSLIVDKKLNQINMEKFKDPNFKIDNSFM
ncbi:cation:dicarboxylate symporter family transporter [Candidatus Arthromitus sp. SFB-turkey]|uniref:cation:dicarboxylate symporter family transporter n=1 Tax=Candidatus Arthromitus sp. SFB-turkey TaxID=1840217 RepID=UPI0007F3BB6F|nr:cation:dicarboxylase symporter family transporter [Candidatus Arthromitus sp. SFB-turkey]OAT86910.1 sodium:dicarboxylate symporter [Candidatus Arthromitus sp. SFB-turkey]